MMKTGSLSRCYATAAGSRLLPKQKQEQQTVQQLPFLPFLSGSSRRTRVPAPSAAGASGRRGASRRRARLPRRRSCGRRSRSTTCFLFFVLCFSSGRSREGGNGGEKKVVEVCQGRRERSQRSEKTKTQVTFSPVQALIVCFFLVGAGGPRRAVDRGEHVRRAGGLARGERGRRRRGVGRRRGWRALQRG